MSLESFLEFQGGGGSRGIPYLGEELFTEIGTKDLLKTVEIDHCREERA